MRAGRHTVVRGCGSRALVVRPVLGPCRGWATYHLSVCVQRDHVTSACRDRRRTKRARVARALYMCALPPLLILPSSLFLFALALWGTTRHRDVAVSHSPPPISHDESTTKASRSAHRRGPSPTRSDLQPENQRVHAERTRAHTATSQYHPSHVPPATRARARFKPLISHVHTPVSHAKSTAAGRPRSRRSFACTGLATPLRVGRLSRWM